MANKKNPVDHPPENEISGAEQAPSNTRRLLIGLGISSVAFVVLLGLVEATCQLLEPPDAIDLAYARPADTYRVFTFGGSTVFGVPSPETGFVAQLEAGLRRLEPTRRVEFVNFAKGGENSSYALNRLEASIDAEPDLIVVLSTHNEFIERHYDRESKKDTLQQSVVNSIRSGMERTATARMLRPLARSIYRNTVSQVRYLPEELVPYDRDADWFEQIFENYYSNLDAIVALAQSRNIPLILCTGPSNVADWPPTHKDMQSSVSNPNYYESIDQINSLMAEGKFAEGEKEADQILSRYGDDAMILYLKGKANQHLGRAAEAHKLFTRAKDLDPYPWRAPSRINNRVRSLASHEGVWVVDVERALERHAEGGLVGFDLIWDNAHPTDFGAAVAAQEIIGEMAKASLFVSPDAVLETPTESLEAFLSSAGFGPDQEVERLLEIARYCMKAPHYYFSASRGYLDDAMQIAPKDWKIWANLGTLDLLDGKIEEGRALLVQATALKGSRLDPTDRLALPYLLEALSETGVELGSLE